MMKIDESTSAQDLRDIEPWLLAARLQAARARLFHRIADAIEALAMRWKTKKRTYYSHESGERRPKMDDLLRYAETFEVPLEFFLRGDENIVWDTVVQEYARQKFKNLSNGDDVNPVETHAKINHHSNFLESNSSHNQTVRTIVLLSAGEIKTLNSNRGVLTRMSGERLPVPPFLEAGENCFWYVMPRHDLSMVSDNQLFSLNPGAVMLVDLDQNIAPGQCVLADIEGREQPVVRVYKAVTDKSKGAIFALDALNPSVESIYITKQEQCRTIGRVIFYGNRI
jgi:SOS-response transcriptional repressor LexA